jgi:PAS domain S-box-containing protein
VVYDIKYPAYKKYLNMVIEMAKIGVSIRDECYKAIVKSMPEGFILRDLDGNIFDVNDATCSSLGYSHEELIKMRIQDISLSMIGKSENENITHLHNFQNNDLIPYSTCFLETQYVRKDGSIVDVFVNNGYLNILEGVVFCFYRDITGQNKIYRQLQKSEKIKNNLLPMVSHELRIPISSIKGFANTMLQKDVKWSEDEKTWFITEIDREADHLSCLVNDLLDMSSMGNKSFKINKRPHSIITILEEVQCLFSQIIDNNMLKVDIEDDLPLVICDKGRIIQVLSNLVDNAIKFSLRGSQIIINAKKHDKKLVVSVIDRGIGIDGEAQNNIFDQFYQVEQGITGGKTGIGLGLYICKGIIDGHGGKIWVESQEGRGSIFSFSLPI